MNATRDITDPLPDSRQAPSLYRILIIGLLAILALTVVAVSALLWLDKDPSGLYVVLGGIVGALGGMLVPKPQQANG